MFDILDWVIVLVMPVTAVLALHDASYEPRALCRFLTRVVAWVLIFIAVVVLVLHMILHLF